MRVFIWILWIVIFFKGVSDAAADEVSVMEGESATLKAGIIKTQKDRIRWYFNNNRIAELNGDQVKICVDDVCPDRFRGRLQLDNASGSLIITNTRKTDSGLYQLQINSRRTEKKFILSVQGALGADRLGSSVSVMEGDSVTLCTGVQTNQNNRINWYFNKGRIAEIIGYRRKVCTDDTCPQRFRDRLKLDSQIGSLTIMKVSTADSGLYTLLHRGREKIFRVVILDSSAEKNLKQKSVTEGESITLDSSIKTTPNDVLKWYFGEILLAEITGDQSQVCEDVQCKDGEEGFRDRLKVNHSSGSLTIMNSSKADFGEYTLLINSTSFYICMNFTVNITVSVASVFGISLNKVIGICAGVLVLLVLLTVAAIYFMKKKGNLTRDQTKHNSKNSTELLERNQKSVSSPNQVLIPLLCYSASQTSNNQEESQPSYSASQTSNNQEASQQSNSASQTSNNQEESQESNSASQTSNNQEESQQSNSASQTSNNQEESQPSYSASQTSNNQEESQLSNSASQTTHNQEEPQPNTSTNQTSHNDKRQATDWKSFISNEEQSGSCVEFRSSPYAENLDPNLAGDSLKTPATRPYATCRPDMMYSSVLQADP